MQEAFIWYVRSHGPWGSATSIRRPTALAGAVVPPNAAPTCMFARPRETANADAEIGILFAMRDPDPADDVTATCDGGGLTVRACAIGRVDLHTTCGGVIGEEHVVTVTVRDQKGGTSSCFVTVECAAP
jgi:hypothetical protein